MYNLGSYLDLLKQFLKRILISRGRILCLQLRVRFVHPLQQVSTLLQKLFYLHGFFLKSTSYGKDQLLQWVDSLSKDILVPRGRAPFGQHQESRPLARSNDIPVLNGFVNTIDWDQNQSDLSDLTLSMRRVTGSPWIADFRCWTWPEVAILGADQKERYLWGRECCKLKERRNWRWVKDSLDTSGLLRWFHQLTKYKTILKSRQRRRYHARFTRCTRSWLKKNTARGTISFHCLTLTVIFIQGDWLAIKYEGVFRGLQLSRRSRDESREKV